MEQATHKVQAAVPLALAGTSNTRDLGGYPTAGGGHTRKGQFYRSDSLARLSKQDIATLLELDIGCVVDLRSSTEIAKTPSPMSMVQEVAYYHVPMLDQVTSQEFLGSLPDCMGKVYVQLLEQDGASFATVMESFARHVDHAILFNCTVGKDRTGVTAMLLLLLAGVSHADILTDYAVSAQNMKAQFAQAQKLYMQLYGCNPPDAVFSSAPENLEMALVYIAQNHGTAEQYLLHYGVSPQDIALICNKLIAN